MKLEIGYESRQRDFPYVLALTMIDSYYTSMVSNHFYVLAAIFSLADFGSLAGFVPDRLTTDDNNHSEPLVP
jgi:hypothetical protein